MLLYCNGKKGFCSKEVCDSSCEHHDGSGARCVKQQTNAERIRTMTDADLGFFLCSLMNADDCYNRCPAREYCRSGHNGMGEYLRRPAKENE